MNSSLRVREGFVRQAETPSVAAPFTDVDVLTRIHAATSPRMAVGVLDLSCDPGRAPIAPDGKS